MEILLLMKGNDGDKEMATIGMNSGNVAINIFLSKVHESIASLLSEKNIQAEIIREETFKLSVDAMANAILENAQGLS